MPTIDYTISIGERNEKLGRLGGLGEKTDSTGESDLYGRMTPRLSFYCHAESWYQVPLPITGEALFLVLIVL